MPIRKDLRPYKRYVPTQQSLDFAERVSEAMGLPFDREAVRQQAHTLYSDMFYDLAHILGIDDNSIRFETGVFHTARIFSANQTSGTPIVALDMVFEHWVFSLTHLLAVCTFTLPDKNEYERIYNDIDLLFQLFENAHLYERSRDSMIHYIVQYEELLNFSGALARAMIVYALCHEMAHCTQGHLDKPTCIQTELEADRIAADYFLQVMEYGRVQTQTFVHIDPKIACAPIMLPMILQLHEIWLVSKGVNVENITDHPAAEQRICQARQVIEPHLNTTAAELLRGMTLAFEDIRKLFI